MPLEVHLKKKGVYKKDQRCFHSFFLTLFDVHVKALMQIGSPSDKTTKKGLQNQIRPGDIYGILQYIMPFIDPLEGQLQV